MAILVICTISGTLLGLFFRVFTLVPAMLLATAIISVMGFTHGLGFGMIALTVLGAMALLQIGYVVGCILHCCIPAHADYTAVPAQIKTGAQLVRSGFVAKRTIPGLTRFSNALRWGHGGGPTMDMSPRRTLNSRGSSSMPV